MPAAHVSGGGGHQSISCDRAHVVISLSLSPYHCADVTLVPPSGLGDVTVIIETLNNHDCLARNLSAYNVTLRLQGGLPGPGTPLFVWRSSADALFMEDPPGAVVAADGSFSLSVEPDSMVTVSTVAGAHKGVAAAPIPATAPLALPYAEDFSGYADDAMARLFADQGGSWAVRNGSLTQVMKGWWKAARGSCPETPFLICADAGGGGRPGRECVGPQPRPADDHW